MIRIIKLIFYIALLIFAFFSGVNYSDEVKGISNWLFEEKSQEIDYKEIENDYKNSKNGNQYMENDAIIEEEILLEEEPEYIDDIDSLDSQNFEEFEEDNKDKE